MSVPAFVQMVSDLVAACFQRCMTLLGQAEGPLRVTGTVKIAGCSQTAAHIVQQQLLNRAPANVACCKEG
jgi:hypothetical protein